MGLSDVPGAGGVGYLATGPFRELARSRGNMGIPGMLHGRRIEERALRRDEVLIRQPGTTWRRAVLCLEEIR
jgi:hypothetical protein